MKTIRVTVRTTVCPRVAMATRSNPSIHSHFGSGRQGGSGFERLDRPKENLLNQTGRVDFLQESAVAVVLDQRAVCFSLVSIPFLTTSSRLFARMTWGVPHCS